MKIWTPPYDWLNGHCNSPHLSISLTQLSHFTQPTSTCKAAEVMAAFGLSHIPLGPSIHMWKGVKQPLLEGCISHQLSAPVSIFRKTQREGEQFISWAWLGRGAIWKLLRSGRAERRPKASWPTAALSTLLYLVAGQGFADPPPLLKAPYTLLNDPQDHLTATTGGARIAVIEQSVCEVPPSLNDHNDLGSKFQAPLWL